MIKRDLTKRNPYLIATITATVYFLSFTIVKYLLWNKFEFLETLLSAVIFWIAFFFLQIYINRKVDKEK